MNVSADKRQALAVFFTNPEPGDAPREPATLGDPLAWGPYALVVDALQHGRSQGDLLPLLGDELRAGLWATDPEGRPTVAGATWADLSAVLGPIEWDWPGWMTRAMLTLIVGQSETGKSALALRIAACYLRGDPWPDGAPYTGKRGRVLWCEAEAGQAINLDRAKKWGLPLGSIICPFSDPLVDVLLEHPEHQTRITSMASSPDIALVVVDSLSGANGRRDENSSDMLGVVKWLAELAKVAGKPVLLTHHLRKRGMMDSDELTLDRVRGSSTIVQTPRLVWALDRPDSTQPDSIRLSVIKSNLGPRPEPLGLSIDGTGVHFRDDAPENPREETQTDKAADLLRALLARGPQKATDIEAEMNGAGLSYRTAKRAKDKLQIVAIKKQGAWWWGLPEKQKDIPI